MVGFYEHSTKTTVRIPEKLSEGYSSRFMARYLVTSFLGFHQGCQVIKTIYLEVVQICAEN